MIRPIEHRVAAGSKDRLVAAVVRTKALIDPPPAHTNRIKACIRRLF